MQEPEYLNNNQTSGSSSDERCANCFIGQQRDAAAIQRSRIEQFSIGRTICNVFLFVNPIPDFGSRPICGQCMHTNGAEVTVAAPKSCFHDKPEADLIQSTPSESIVDTTQRDWRLPVASDEFLTAMTKEEESDLSKAVRDLVTRGRILLAVERYKKGEASLGKAAEVAGLPVGQMMTLLGEFGVRSKIDPADYRQSLANLAKVW